MGIATKVSDHTRAWVASELRKARDREDTEKGERQGVASLAADNVRSADAAKRTNEAYNKAHNLIENAGSDGIQIGNWFARWDGSRNIAR